MGEGVAVDLSVALKTLRGSTATELSKLGYFGLKIATSPLFGFQGAQNGLGRRQV